MAVLGTLPEVKRIIKFKNLWYFQVRGRVNLGYLIPYRIARWGASSSAMGAPNRAIIPSPVISLTVPS